MDHVVSSDIPAGRIGTQLAIDYTPILSMCEWVSMGLDMSSFIHEMGEKSPINRGLWRYKYHLNPESQNLPSTPSSLSFYHHLFTALH